MTSKKKPRTEEGGEISVLIKALREADLRLEELTGGEVDVVADRDGRSFMLKHAQDEFRHNEAAKQAAILDALPANIALVDPRGLIVSVNEGWRQFSAANGQSKSTAASSGVGANYLEVCDNTRGEAEPEARQVAAGLRAVLSGHARRYSLEYPCNSPTERRWFMVMMTPIAAAHLKGVAVMHFDVSQQKHGEQAVWRFAAAMDATADGIYLVDRAEMRLIHVNDAGCRLANRTREQLMQQQPPVFLGKTREERERAYDALIANAGVHESLEYRRREGGVDQWLEIRRHAQFLGERWVIVILVHDITARKQAQTNILHLNRVLALLSGVNSLIVRVRDRIELFQEACRIAVNAGGFRIAWIAMVDNALMKVVPVASQGADQELLTFIRDRVSLSADAPSGNTMTARAIREKRPIVSNDLESTPDGVFNKKYTAIGIYSMSILPLMVADEAVGVIALYAAEREFFHDGELRLLTGLAADIAFAIDHIEKQERIDYLAYYDVLTGLANRHLFMERVAQFVRGAVAVEHKLALLCIDLERFKNINDSLGQAAGDALLKQVADWLVVHVGEVELLARVEADHFAVVLPDVTHEGDVGRLLENTIEQFLGHAFQLDGAPFRVAAKFGIAMFPDDGADGETLFKHAEAALKRAKVHGDRYLFYTEKMTESMSGRLTLENQLRQALERREFVLHYQPKMNLSSGQMVGAEALIRWNDPRTGLVAPGRFIPVLEETGLIYDVGRWALRTAIADYIRWRSAGLDAVRVAVNVSPLQLRNRRFVDEIRQAVGGDTRAAAGLELEITESLIMEDVRLSIQSLEAIREMGVTIAIDDFGTGFSSLSYLAKLPVHTLKIDRSFVTDMTTSADGLTLVSTIITLAHSLKLKVVAEGVETDEQSRILRLLQCDEMQGYLISKPLPAADFESLYLARPAMRDTISRHAPDAC